MIFKIRDSVDIYIIGGNILYFYFMNTRKSYEFKVSQEVIELIKLIDNKRTVSEMIEIYSINTGKFVSESSVLKTLTYLEKLNIITQIDAKSDISLGHKDLKRYERQINFLSEFNMGEHSGIMSQSNINKTSIVVFGCGSIGGDIALLLVMAGIKEITLVDYKNVSETDICRHLFYKSDYIGIPKVTALKNELTMINSDINVRTMNIRIEPSTDIETLIKEADFIVNTMDEPYIGYTSLKISRVCVAYEKPHYIGGGFDIHLMSTGELIIPGKTPCVDCYTKHFKRKLANWTPENKKNIDIINEYGGFSSQALFSASFASMQIIKFICDFEDDSIYNTTRGEMDFDTYQLDFLDVERDKDCITCGRIKSK